MTRTMTNQYLPDRVSAPGETIAEVIEDRGMTQTELASRVGLTHKTVNEIIAGKAPLTHGTARALERVLGIPAGFWNRMEASYRESLARQAEEEQLREQQEWLKQFPLKEMVKQQFVTAFRDPIDQFRELLGFLGVASPAQWNTMEAISQGRCRQAQPMESDPIAIAVWLRQGEILAQKTVCAPYNLDRFEEALREARRLTNEKPEVFLPQLKAIGAGCGVAVVFVPSIPGARVCGFTRWLTPTKALLQISDRYRRADSFWFTLFHEAGHIVLHGKRDSFLEGEKGQDDVKEEEANEFARDILIPLEERAVLLAASPRTREEICAWAERLGIAPGIVAGALHHEKLLPHNHCQDLRVELTWRAK